MRQTKLFTDNPVIIDIVDYFEIISLNLKNYTSHQHATLCQFVLFLYVFVTVNYANMTLYPADKQRIKYMLGEAVYVYLATHYIGNHSGAN